jgi:hypothetical protein
MASNEIMVRLDEKAFADLNKRLAGLANDLPAKVFVNAARKALKPTLDAARAGAPVRTGSLRKALWIRVKKYPRNKSIYAALGARSNFVGKDEKGRDIKPFKYLHLVEFGHRGRTKVTDKQISELYDHYEKTSTWNNRSTFRNLKYDIRTFRGQNSWWFGGGDGQRKLNQRKAESALRKRYRMKINKAGAGNRGVFRGYGFMRKSFNMTKNSALNIFVNECQKGVQQVLANRPIPAAAA